MPHPLIGRRVSFLDDARGKPVKSFIARIVDYQWPYGGTPTALVTWLDAGADTGVVETAPLCDLRLLPE